MIKPIPPDFPADAEAFRNQFNPRSELTQQGGDHHDQAHRPPTHPRSPGAVTVPHNARPEPEGR
jgi:hypothetical protein